MDFDLPPDSVNCSWHKAEGTNDTGGWQIKIQGLNHSNAGVNERHFYYG